jgi:hypothetical protein
MLNAQLHRAFADIESCRELHAATLDPVPPDGLLFSGTRSVYARRTFSCILNVSLMREY